MEKALFPLKYMKQTQGVNNDYSHKGSYAIDYGSRGGKENLYAPFTGIIKRIYKENGNAVWLESVDKVLWADGTNDYMTALTIHDEDVSDLKVGQEIKQNQVYYQQGSSGEATGIHTHLEVGKGKFEDSGWKENEYGIWTINNAVHPANALFLTEDIIIVDDGGYDWKKLIGNPVKREKEKDQIEIIIDDLRCRKNPNGKILGYINKGIYNILDKQYNGTYEWYKVGSNRWVAYSDDWAKIYLKEEDVEQDSLKELEKENKQLKQENEELKKQLAQLNKQKSIFSFTCPKTDKYVIRLNKGEILSIKDS